MKRQSAATMASAALTEGSAMQARVTILNQLGLHARPAMAFVDTANAFACDIKVRKGEQTVDGKSIMQMLSLGAGQGTELLIDADGVDAADALEALQQLVAAKFDED
jgi:phosphocarrier protein HPr